MVRHFTLKQLFSIVDGRLSTSIGDVYEILNHVFDTSLMTHQLPVAKDYLMEKNPKWVKAVSSKLESMGITKQKDFLDCMELVEKDNPQFAIGQLKDEIDTSDFRDYMVNNSLLLKKK